MPSAPIFFLKLYNNKIAVTVADIEVANANPLCAMYLINMKFRVILIITDVAELIIGVLVSCKA